MSRQDWSNTVRRCRSCGRELTLNRDGAFPVHMDRMPSGRRYRCLASLRNALTSDELLHRRGPGPVPVFRQVGHRDYESKDGIFRLVQLDGGQTQAWNVEYTNDFESRLNDEDGSVYSLPGYPVDGARTKDDALSFFRAWWAENGEAFKARWAA